MSGMNAQTGRRIDDIAHLHQSVGDILTTPKGSRVHRRAYGAEIFPLLDQPDSPTNRLRIYAATAEALARWEPRLAVSRVSMNVSEDGQTEIDLEGEYRPDGRNTGEIIVIKGVRV